MKNLLTCDINRRTYMSYDSRQRCSKGRATQSGAHPSPRACALPEAAERLAREWSVTKRQAYRYLQRAQQLRQPVPVQDAKVSFTVKLSRRLVASAPDLRRLHRFDPERDRQPSRASGTPSWGRPWLTTRRVGNARCGWNINLIGCGQRSWPRFMNAWCPTRSRSPLRAATPLPGKQAGGSE